MAPVPTTPDPISAHYGVGYGRYMLLSPDELVRFRKRVDEGDPRIYDDEYDVDDLAQDPE